VSSQQLVVFSLRGGEYALPIRQVQEIIRYTEPRPVASEATSVRGVISLRGKILPVVDVAGRLGLTDTSDAEGKIVIVESEGSSTIGVIVDDVEEVVTINSEDLEEVPVADQRLVQAIARLGDRLVVVLQSEGVFAEAEGVETGQEALAV
jgi:purine-binding chemotaxis protein CheW